MTQGAFAEHILGDEDSTEDYIIRWGKWLRTPCGYGMSVSGFQYEKRDEIQNSAYFGDGQDPVSEATDILIARMPEPFRAAVINRYYGLMSEREVAAYMHTSRQYVMRWVEKGVGWIDGTVYGLTRQPVNGISIVNCSKCLLRNPELKGGGVFSCPDQRRARCRA